MIRGLMAASVLGSLALMSCAHGKMVPAESAEVVPQSRSTAVSLVDGVRCFVGGDSWRGLPRDLAETVTPVKVRIRNNSGRPIRLLYQHFALVGSSGHEYRPLPSLPIDAGKQEAAGAVLPTYATSNFFVAPSFKSVYKTLEPWPAPLPRDKKFYQHQYSEWSRHLPTRDMIAQALPEGVLADEGVISGFLYFENATSDEDELVFTAEMNEGDGDLVVAAIEIPFRVE